MYLLNYSFFHRYAVASPINKREDVCQYIDELFQIPTVPLPNFLCLTLTPSNQIIHPGKGI